MRWLNLLFVLVLNAVPLYGVMGLGWSASTVVMLYWFENLLMLVFTSARIALHRALTRKRGHWNVDYTATTTRGGTSTTKHGKTTFLATYLLMAVPFTLVHGIFVGVFVLIGAQNHSDDAHWALSRDQFWQGAQWLMLALVADFLIDVATLRRRSFAWLKAYVDQRMGRVLILHLAIIFGMWGMLATESPFAVLYVLIGLKTLWDLAASNTSARADALPAQPPAWALKLADAVAKDEGGATKMATDWQQARADMIRAARDDEEIMPA